MSSVLAALQGSNVEKQATSLAAWKELERRRNPFNTKDYLASPVTCEQCTSLTEALTVVLSDKITIEKIIPIYEAGCDVIPDISDIDRWLCKAVGDELLKHFPDIIESLGKVEWTPTAFCATVLNACEIDCCVSDAPEQVKLKLAPLATSMRVSWVARKNVPSMVEYTENGLLVRSAPASVSTFTAGGWRGYVYDAEMTGLKPDTYYNYTVGAEYGGERRSFYFRTLPADAGSEHAPLRVAQIADVDYGEQGRSTLLLTEQLVREGSVHLVVFVGDISYADGNEHHSDVFGRLIEGFSAYAPLMTLPGNHEAASMNFASYRARFQMPGTCPEEDAVRDALPTLPSTQLKSLEECNMYYSFNVSDTHFTMLAGETPFLTGNFDEAQVAWAREDFKRAKEANSRWTLALNHRPMYCTTKSNKECDTLGPWLRAQMEGELRGNADIFITGHVHSYERDAAVFNEEVIDLPDAPMADSRSDEERLAVLRAHIANPYSAAGLLAETPLDTYTNPSVPIHVTQSGGNREGQRTGRNDRPWSMQVFDDPGVGVITITPYQLRWDFVSSTQIRALDTVVIRKTI